jgi:hypothetical protein
MQMKALSVRQPWASLIVLGLKCVEIRSWPTDYRGPLLIHAAKTLDELAMRRFHIENVPTGCLIGTFDLIEVEKLTPTRWRELANEHLDGGAFAANLYAWHIANPHPLKMSLPYRGDRNLFQVIIDDELARQAGL